MQNEEDAKANNTNNKQIQLGCAFHRLESRGNLAYTSDVLAKSEAAAIRELRAREPGMRTYSRLRPMEPSLRAKNINLPARLRLGTSILQWFRWRSWVPTKQRAPGDNGNRSASNTHLRGRSRASA